MKLNKLLNLCQSNQSTFRSFVLDHSQSSFYNKLIGYFQMFCPFVMQLLEHSNDAHDLHILGYVAGVMQYLSGHSNSIANLLQVF